MAALRRTTPDLHGVTVVVTGGARGIGAATAAAFARRGATVWIRDIDDAVAEATARTSPNTHSAALEVTDHGSWTDFLERVAAESARPVDILVDNAGVMPVGAFEHEADHTTDLILDVDVREEARS